MSNLKTTPDGIPFREMDADDLRKRQDALEATLRGIKEERERRLRIQSLRARKQLIPMTELAHSLLCTHNHTDSCAWDYEEAAAKDHESRIWHESDSAHRRWLDRMTTAVAEGLRWKMSSENLCAILAALVAAQKSLEEDPNADKGTYDRVRLDDVLRAAQWFKP